jgi:glycosyltransferase involved in cell wall biosynthesis
MALEQLHRAEIEVFHPTYFDDYYLPALGAVPLVVTMFDMIYELYPETYPSEAAAALSARKKNISRRARKIIAISHSTKRDLCRLFDVPPSNVAVIHLANTLPAGSGSMTHAIEAALPEQYILFVGIRAGYKNFPFFISSMQQLFEKQGGLHLICTGNPFSPDETALFRSMGIADRVQHIQAHDNDLLRALYRNAKALVFPSLYEGFGLPVLEAMGCGCPVIVSRSSSLPEVAGDAALYIEPKDRDSIRNAVADVLDSRTLRSELRAKGIEQEKKFSWNFVAEQTADIYRAVL